MISLASGSWLGLDVKVLLIENINLSAARKVVSLNLKFEQSPSAP
jgi:hypothetical protein